MGGKPFTLLLVHRCTANTMPTCSLSSQVRQDGELNAQRAGQERIASLRKAAFQNKFRGGGRGRGVRGKVAGKRPAKAARGDGAGAAKQGGGGAGGSGRGRGAAGCTGGSSAVGILRFAKASAVR